MNASLLVELFTEELPPKALKQLGDAFGHGIEERLAKARLKDGDEHAAKIFATPRRLAVLIHDVKAKAADRSESRKLMPVKVAFGADGKPSVALAKRLEKEGGAIEQVERRKEGDTEYVFLTQAVPGVSLSEGLQAALAETIAKLPIPKEMAYQLSDGTTTVSFVRPAHGLLALHGPDIVPLRILGLDAGRITHGHRFQGVPDIEVAAADAYEEALRAHGKVIASFEERRSAIATQLDKRAKELGASLGSPESIAPLLDEVTALVEFPAVYAGEFEAEYLAVPQECLILTMRANQKYFPLFDKSGKLTNRFLIVSNMELRDPKNIVEGNQRVVRPRLADARFFFETDKRTKLIERLPQLGSIVYHNKLGNQLERTERVEKLCGAIARLLNVESGHTQRAALLAKVDLVTSMVGEFPELQGIMGRHYATHDGEPDEVAQAIEEHYRPRFSGDSLPETTAGTILALADKLETLAGLFAIGQQPTGDKDPFALRRHALGVIRILVEKHLPLGLEILIRHAIDPFWKSRKDSTSDELTEFIFDRMRGFLRDLGYSTNEIEAVIVLRPDRIDQAPARIDAVRAFAKFPEAESLASANKRIGNILKKADSSASSIDSALLIEPAEKALADIVVAVRPDIQARFAANDYVGTLKLLARMKDPVDTFFNDVMVMDESLKLRANRIALLRELHGLMNQVADISKLAT